MKVNIPKKESFKELQIRFMEKVVNAIKNLEKNNQSKTDFTDVEQAINNAKKLKGDA